MPHQAPLLYLDANVLLPAYLRAIFLDLADAGLVRVHWGEQVLESRFRDTTDPKDAHVAAGALRLSQATPAHREVLLVTGNIKHLPPAAFEGTLVRPVKPGVVLTELLAAKPWAADVLDAMLKRFRSPPMSRTDLLDILDASNCRAFATALSHAWGFTAAKRRSPT